ncbi:MAG: hypothetical protein WCT99_12100, partial [Bacteroidota bacterium]
MKKYFFFFLTLFFYNNNEQLFSQIEGCVRGVSEADYQMIVNRLNLTLGYDCETEDIIRVDSVLKKFDSDGGIENPYNTLNHCFVFTYYRVTAANESKSKLSVGILKDGNVTARLDTVIETFYSTSGEIKTIADINNDGAVDILITRTLGVSPPPGQGYWIVSWNGSSLHLINDVTKDEESVIVSPWDGITYVDINGDGIYELETEMVDESGKLEKVIYSWNGQLYGLWSNPPQPLPSGTYPRYNVDAIIRCKVTKKDSGYFSYSYSVTNQPASKQLIDQVLLGSPDTLRTLGTSPSRWLIGGQPGKFFGWMAMPGFNVYLQQGKTEKAFGFEDNNLPSICNAYVRGHNPSGTFLVNGQLDLDKWYQDVIGNSKIIRTIAPDFRFKKIAFLFFLDTLLSYTRQSVTLGWLKSKRDDDKEGDERSDDGIVRNIEKRIEKAKKELVKGDSVKARQELEKLVKKVEKL